MRFKRSVRLSPKMRVFLIPVMYASGQSFRPVVSADKWIENSKIPQHTFPPSIIGECTFENLILTADCQLLNGSFELSNIWGAYPMNCVRVRKIYQVPLGNVRPVVRYSCNCLLHKRKVRLHWPDEIQRLTHLSCQGGENSFNLC